jgi:hypothetical protein
MGNFHSDTAKSEDKFIAGKQPNASQLFWANYDLIHEIMDFMRTFGEIAIIPRICKTTSDSLFSYRFKDREDQKCDWILFSQRAATYYEVSINNQFRTWYGRKMEIPKLVRPNNYSRLTSMKFHSLNTNLEYVDKNDISVLLGCKELKFKNFKLSQLTRICESDIQLLAHTLELQVDPIIFTQTFDNDTRSLGTILPNVTKIIINGGSSASSFVEIAMMLNRIPSLRSLDLSHYYSSPELASLLPNSLTELVISTGCSHTHYRTIDLSSLTELRKLHITGEWYDHTRQLSMIFPSKLEHLTISRLNWGINQLIPDSVKTLSCSDDNFYIKNTIEKSSVENLILCGIAPWWWEDFKIPPSVKNIQCSSYMGLVRIMKQYPSSRLTHLLYPGIHNPWVNCRFLFCGKNLDEIPRELTGDNVISSYHIPLEEIRLNDSIPVVPIPWTRNT